MIAPGSRPGIGTQGMALCPRCRALQNGIVGWVVVGAGDGAGVGPTVGADDDGDVVGLVVCGVCVGAGVVVQFLKKKQTSH